MMANSQDQFGRRAKETPPDLLCRAAQRRTSQLRRVARWPGELREPDLGPHGAGFVDQHVDEITLLPAGARGEQPVVGAAQRSHRGSIHQAGHHGEAVAIIGRQE